MKKIILLFSGIGKIQIAFFKFGVSLVILALSGIYYMCEAEVNSGGTGVELYYAPMLEYIFTTFIIFWAGTLLLDLVDKDARKRKDM